MKKTTALQRCDKKIREACQRLKELQRVETPYELLALDDPKIAIELQKIKEDIESTKDYLKRMREWYEEEPGENIQRQTAVFFTGEFYGQTPIDLLKDPSNKPQLKALYPVYHLHCKVKHLNSNPCTFISQERIGREYFGWTQQTVSYWTIKLEDAGWCTIIRLGQGHSNIIVLHERKGKRITTQEKRNFIKLVRVQQARYKRGL